MKAPQLFPNKYADLRKLENGKETCLPEGFTPKLTGVKLLKAAINAIIEHPKEWDQGVWHSWISDNHEEYTCGSSHCVFGYCQILAGLEPNSGWCYDQVIDLLRLNLRIEEAVYLCNANRSFSELYKAALNMIEGKKLNTPRNFKYSGRPSQFPKLP